MKMNFLSELFANVGNVTWQHAVMWYIGGVLIYLAIAKKMEPALLLPIGFGTILVNLPLSGAVTQGEEVGVLTLLFDSGIANELFPLLLFIMVTRPNMAAPISMSRSLRGTCSFGVNSDVSQNRMAPPVTLNVTMSMPVMPCVMASLPSGAIRPQNAHAKNRQR